MPSTFAFKPQRFAAGFTLIEILVVIAILAILGALVVPQIMERPGEAKVVAATEDVRRLVGALKLYRLDNDRYPSTEQGLRALSERPSTGQLPVKWRVYVEKLPQDPWGNAYQYLNPGIKGEIDVLSYGADGQPGGEGAAADIGSWML